MIEVITDIQQLTSLKPQWDALAELQKNPLLSFDWFATCAEIIHSADALRVVVVRRRDTVVAIAPLCLINRDGMHRLELLGTSVLYEPSGFLYVDQHSLKQLLRGTVKLGLPLVLLRLPDDQILLSCLAAVSWRNAITLRRISAPSAFLALPSDWNLFLESLSSSRRYDFRRKRKCLEKSGKVMTRIMKPDLSDLPYLVHEALLVEDSSWKGRQGSSLLRNPSLRSFFECYMRKACENGTLRICFIDIDNTPVSMHIAVESDDAFWVLKLGYNESLAKCSPGAQLAMDTIEYSVRQGIARYEFLGSQESWQQAWPIKKHVCFTLLIYPFSLRGLLGFFGFATGYAKKQLLRLFAKT